mmetsp:Transcript_13471/g.42999  ORF Transcript_13471/g.42999 Transcript_13471/m.42999 type:complete len:212 (-) Transcript_13471:107-742(-)
MNAIVPQNCVMRRSSGSSSRRKPLDSPKSATLMEPGLSRSVIRMFSGFRSRWMTPSLCMCATAPSSDRIISLASFSEKRPDSPITSNSSPPPANSITMYAFVDDSKKASNLMMLGWFSLCKSSASSRNRFNSPGFTRALLITFTANSSPVSRLWARYTVPNAPLPSRPPSWYFRLNSSSPSCRFARGRLALLRDPVVATMIVLIVTSFEES